MTNVDRSLSHSYAQCFQSVNLQLIELYSSLCIKILLAIGMKEPYYYSIFFISQLSALETIRPREQGALVIRIHLYADF